MDTRIIIVVGIFITVLSLGAFWLVIGSARGYDAFDVVGMVGGYIGGQQVNPLSYQASDYNAYIAAALPPLIIGSWALDGAMAALAAGFFLAFASFARWTLTYLAGILQVVGALLWLAGVAGISQEVGAKLSQWPGFYGSAGAVSVSASAGAYIAAASGFVFLAIYFLTRGGRLDTPLDSSLPTSAS